VVGADTGAMAFEQIVSRFSDRFAIIDNHMRYVTSHILAPARSRSTSPTTGRSGASPFGRMLEGGEYAEAQREMARVAMPFMALWSEMETYTSGDGYLDKLCMELVGLDSSTLTAAHPRRRPLFREKARQMLHGLRRPRRRSG
jgi:4-hydroxy-tetrahydrodipicolinate synthase